MKTNRRLYIAAIAVLIIAVACVCIFAGCEATKEATKKVHDIIDDIVATGDDDLEMKSGETYKLPSKIIFRTAGKIASNDDSGLYPTHIASIKVTATIGPMYVTKNNKKLNWTFSWVNPNSEWATGKNVATYIWASKSSDTLSATIYCEEAFGEQIKLTVSAEGHPEAKDECLIDFKKKLERVDVVFHKGSADGENASLSADKLMFDFNDTSAMYLTGIPVFTVGSVEADEYTYTLRFCAEGSMENYAQAVASQGFKGMEDYVFPSLDFSGMEIKSARNLIDYLTTESDYAVSMNCLVNQMNLDEAAFSFILNANSAKHKVNQEILVYYDKSTVNIPIETVTIDKSTWIIEV